MCVPLRSTKISRKALMQYPCQQSKVDKIPNHIKDIQPVSRGGYLTTICKAPNVSDAVAMSLIFIGLEKTLHVETTSYNL